MTQPRLAVRAIILRDNKILLVNAYPPEKGSKLLCAPGGGVDRGQSLPDNLVREVREETGLEIAVGEPCLVNEFHDPAGTFHQVDVYFRARIISGDLDDAWVDPEGVVTERHWVAREDLARLRVKPDTLGDIAWGTGFGYDPLEPIQR